MNDQAVLDFIRDRFQRIEEQNDQQLALLQDHLNKDTTYYQKVERHDAYWKVAASVITVGLGGLLAKLGFK